MIIATDIGRHSATIFPVALIKRPHAIPTVLAQLRPCVHPRPTIKPLQPVFAREFDHVAPVGRVAKLHPHVPEPRRLEELLTTGIGQRPTKCHQFTAVGAREPLKRFGRSLELPPLGFGHPQHLLPPRRQRRTVHVDLTGRTQRRDRRVELRGILAEVGLRLGRRRPPRRGVTALGHRLEKAHRTGLAEQIDVLHDRQAVEDGRLGSRHACPACDDAGEKRRQYDRHAGQPLPCRWPCRSLRGPAPTERRGSAARLGRHPAGGHSRHLDGGGHHVGRGRRGGQHVEQIPDVSQRERGIGGRRMVDRRRIISWRLRHGWSPCM
jgi:hypothetical protein